MFLAPPIGNTIPDKAEMRNKLNIGLNLKNNKKNEEVSFVLDTREERLGFVVNCGWI